MESKIIKIQETNYKTQEYWNNYTNTTKKLDKLIMEYVKLKSEEIEIYNNNNKIEINFRIIPNQKIIIKLIYLSKAIKYKFKQNSLTSYTMTPIT